MRFGRHPTRHDYRTLRFANMPRDEAAGSGRGEAYAAVPKAAQNPDFAPGFGVQHRLADLQAVSA